MSAASGHALLQVQDLAVRFATPEGDVSAVNGLGFTLERGQTFGIVGESGSGKSQSMLALMGLLAGNGSASGVAKFQGQDLLGLAPAQLNRIRGNRIAMIFQDPMTWLNPYLTVERQMTEVLELHKGLSRRSARQLAIAALESVRMPDAARSIDRYPHQFSGGMRQRIMIGLGLVLRPKLVICDEPTTALDVIVEAGFIDLLKRLQKEFALTIVVITHNLGLVAELADRIAVMYAGQIVENAPAEAVFHQPLHPYTQGLIACVPNIDVEQETLTTMDGSPPGLVDPPPGCSFAPRCPLAMGRCREQEPPLLEHRPGHWAACWRINNE